jgi:predicted transcriptional regulator
MITQEELIKLHHIEKKSVSEIQQILKCNKATVYKLMKKHNIQIIKKVHTNNDLLNNKDWLYEQYVVYKRPLKDIAKELKTSRWTITKKMQEFDIDIKISPISVKKNDFSKQKLSFHKNVIYDTVVKEIQEYLHLYGFSLVDNYFINREKNIIIDIIPSNVKLEKNYSKKRHSKFTEEGFRLIQFFDVDWLQKEEICKSMIENVMGCSDQIYARNCQIVELEYEQSKSFLNDNHLYGANSSCKINLALEYGGDIVCCMSFSHSRYDKNIQYELNRFCNKVGLSVVGGASKLFSRFINLNDPESIVSYCDKRYSIGNLYEKLGFKKLGQNPPNYFYVVLNELKSRQSYQKHKLKDKLLDHNDSYTEIQNMMMNGFYPLYDSGHYKYIWHK